MPVPDKANKNRVTELSDTGYVIQDDGEKLCFILLKL